MNASRGISRTMCNATVSADGSEKLSKRRSGIDACPAGKPSAEATEEADCQVL